MTNKTYRLSQIELIAAISKELDRQHPGIGVNTRHFNAITRAANIIMTEFDRPDSVAPAGAGLDAWLNSDRVGLSSRFISYTIASKLGIPLEDGKGRAENYHPADVADFDRCVHLIEVVPEFADHLPALNACGPYWQAVVQHWDEWKTMLQAEMYKELYQAMREAYRD